MIAPPLAHAGHVVEGVLYAIPILVVAVVIVLQRIRERAADADGAPHGRSGYGHDEWKSVTPSRARRRTAAAIDLRTPGAFDLVLLDAWGDVIRCECDGRGAQSLHKGLHPGRFFVAIRSRDRSSARYTLLRASRTITTSRLRANGAGSAAVAPGMAATITVLTHPPVDGPVTVTFEQFDPLAGWQFVRALRATAHAGIATVHWTAPTVGRWRATATYDGTRAVAPSDTGFVKLLVAGPLRD